MPRISRTPERTADSRPTSGQSDTSSGWTRWEKVLGLATALAGLVAAILGVVSIQATQAKADAQTTVVDQSSELGALQRQIAADKATIESYRAANDDQAAQLAAKDAEIKKQADQIQAQAAQISKQNAQLPPDAAAAAADPATPAIRHKGNLSLRSFGDIADLNAPASDAQWGAGEKTVDDSDAIWIQAGVLLTSGTDAAPLNSGEKADYKTCSTKTTYGTTDSVGANNIPDKPKLCLRLTSGRYAVYRLVDRQQDVVTLEITVWELP